MRRITREVAWLIVLAIAAMMIVGLPIWFWYEPKPEEGGPTITFSYEFRLNTNLAEDEVVDVIRPSIAIWDRALSQEEMDKVMKAMTETNPVPWRLVP